MNKKNVIVRLLLTASLLSLAACGGGGGGGGGSDDPTLRGGAPVFDGGISQESGTVTGPGADPALPADPGAATDPGGGSFNGGAITIPAPDFSAGASGTVGAGTAVGASAWDGLKPARSKTVMISAPGALTQADTEYVLTQDIIAAGTAFTIKASNVTLNLNGRTVRFAEAGGAGPFYGVTIQQYNLSNVAVVNGTIRQGAGASATNTSRLAWHPIYFSVDVLGFELAGLKVEYRTPETSGLYAMWGKQGTVRHCDFNDTGSTIINRHQSLATVKLSRAPGMKIHHNRVVRARQGGIDIGNGAVVYENSITLDSHSTNSVAIGAYEVDGFTIYNNTIYGRGEHPTGIGMVSKSKNGKVYNNLIDVQNTRGGVEYGATGSAGMRMTWGTDNVEVWNNHITVSAQANLIGPGLDSWGRGLWVGLPDPAAKATFRNNTIIARNNDGRAKAAAIAVVCLNQSPGLVFRNNLVISNWANVVLADNYGHANGHARFIGNTFRKEDAYGTYKTIKSDYRDYVSTGVFINNTYENGASAVSVEGQFSSTQVKEMAFGWNYTLSVTNGAAAAAGATVQILDNAGAQVFSGTADASGKVVAQLTEYLATNKSSYPVAGKLTRDVFGVYGNKIVKNPYTVKVQAGSKSSSRTFQITGNTQMAIAL